MWAGASVLCGGQRRLLVPVALIVSTSEPFHSHIGVRALENMERVFVSPYQFQFNHTKQQKPRTLRNLTKTYGQQQLTDQKRKPIKTQQRFREIQHTTTESKYSSQTEIFNNLGCDSHPFSISIQVVTTEMLLLNEAMFLCLAIAAADIAAIAAKEGIAKDIGMATPLAIKFQFFVCGVAVGVASTMVVGLIKANDKEKPKPKPQPEPQPEPKPTTKKTTIVDVVYVFPKGRCYHSPKCTSSQPAKNDKLQEPTEMTLTEAKQMKKVECRCIACNEFFRSSTWVRQMQVKRSSTCVELDALAIAVQKQIWYHSSMVLHANLITTHKCTIADWWEWIDTGLGLLLPFTGSSFQPRVRTIAFRSYHAYY